MTEVSKICFVGKEVDMMSAFSVESIICDTDVAKVAVLGVPDRPGVAAHLFSELKKLEIPVEMVIQSVMRGNVNDIAFLIKDSRMGEAIEVCRKMPREIESQGVTFDTEICRIALYGKGFSKCPELLSDVFSALAERGINLEMIAATPESLCCILAESRSIEAMELLEKKFVKRSDS